MKKSIVIVIVLVLIVVGVLVFGGKKTPGAPTTSTSPATTSAPVSETIKVSDKISEYKNEELGFAVKYPSIWEKTVSDTGVIFAIPSGQKETSAIGKLEGKIVVVSGKCSFPPVTTINERKTVTSGSLSFNMISMSNSVQGRNYFDRMYSLQKDNVCYLFTFSSITLSPASKGVKGTDATIMTNNNKAIVDAADQAFTTTVKSFTYVSTPAGQDETVASPKK